jgi:hypothetical protein
MKVFLTVALIALGAASLAKPATADLAGLDDSRPFLVNPRMQLELRSAAARPRTSTHVPNDTTWVGFNPAYAGSNYWSIGAGHRRPPGDTSPVPNDDTGYWDFDHPVHGDSLQGWWPFRHNYTSFFIANNPDYNRPWHAVDIGNQISSVIYQGTGNRRTLGVTSAWHVDAGVNAKVPDPGQGDVNPRPPRWTPLAGSRSAWCGLRAHGDVTAVDALTGNPYNIDALPWVQHGSYAVNVGPGWTSHKFPGYAGQWDQMLFRDVDIGDTTLAPSGANVSVSFSYRTRMSTGKNTIATTRTGWFDKDPLAVVAGNFISSTDAGNGAPIDSFMVYVGRPVADTVGAAWTGSDGATHAVFDPVRRWFGELIRASEAGGHYELFTTYGNRPPISAPADSNAFVTQTATRNVTYGQLRAAWGSRIRLVFRVKTNRGNETFSDDAKGSMSGAYTSGYLGAAQVDEVAINLGGGTVPLGGFESEGDIDNHPESSALNYWKTSSKPPAMYFHVHDLSSLTYEDVCGPPTSNNRICDMAGAVVSMGDHDDSEEATGASGTTEQDHYHGIFSPTINLAFDPLNPTARNNMGVDADTAVPTYDFAIFFNVYTGYFDLFDTGQAWTILFQSYPAAQSDGTRMWGDMRSPNTGPFSYPEKTCYDFAWPAGYGGQVRTINANGIPDSIRIGILKMSQCHRFGLTTNCGGTAGGYVDNVSLALIDANYPPLTMYAAQLWNDTFPANETTGLPGTAAFDTTAALIKTGYNIAPLTGDLTHYDVPGDTLVADAAGDSVEVQLEFRILPGPGNYVVAGDPCSGLRRVPTDTTRIAPGDGSFWTEYILNPGKDKDAFPTTGPCKGGGPLRHDQRWSELTWCNARMDTADYVLFPIQARGIGDPWLGSYASMYHEDDKHLAALGLSRHKCFLVDTLLAGNSTNITCSSVPAWVTAGGVPYKTGYDGNPSTVEGTKIIPDGLLTPGSHVEYFLKKKDLATGAIALCPDTTMVYPQRSEENLDSHRWQQFAVLPDAWKFAAYGGLGKACMLYVDWSDRYGDERIWVSVADSIGATTAAKRGAHNGWTAPGGADVNDPAYFVNANAQPGTTWDMYGIKNSDSYYGAPAGTLGARLLYRGLGTYLTGKWAKNAPTPEMMAAYYRMLLILTGDLYTAVGGYYSNDRGIADTEFIRQFVTGATAEDHRGLWCGGSYFVQGLDEDANTTMLGILGVSLRHTSFLTFSGNYRPCIDLIPAPVITTNGDIYGLRNRCLAYGNVLDAVGDAQPASYYDPVGSNPLSAPYVASVFQDAETANNPDRHYQTLVDGWSLASLGSRLCDASSGRLAYMWNVFTNVFGKICAVAGTGQMTTEVPNNGDGRTFVNLAGIGNNPLRQGSAVIHLTLAQADRVSVRIYDVSGRLVRTLVDGQMFKAGKADPALTWDGLDNNGSRVARGAYFVNVRYANSCYEANRKMIVLR